MATARKVNGVKELADELSHARMAVLADYRGLTVAEMGRLRRLLREGETNLTVAKNTLIKLAAAETGVDAGIDRLLAGPTAIAFIHNSDIGKSTKVLTDYARVSKVFAIKGAVLGKTVLDPDRVQQLAALPPREVLLGRVVGAMQAPIAGLVTVLGGTVRGLMYVLQARRDQLTAQ